MKFLKKGGLQLMSSIGKVEKIKEVNKGFVRSEKSKGVKIKEIFNENKENEVFHIEYNSDSLFGGVSDGYFLRRNMIADAKVDFAYKENHLDFLKSVAE